MSDVSNLKQRNSEFIEDRICTFRNKEFDMIDILFYSIIEYIYYICKDYRKYMSQKRINKFIRDLFKLI